MVHVKASTGCDKCRERRIKCDEQKPYCNRCTKRGIECPGYRSTGGVVFVDAGAVFQKPSDKKSRRDVRLTDTDVLQACLSRTLIEEVRPDSKTLSVNFFVQNVVFDAAKDPFLSKGHFDNIPEMCSSASPSSPFFPALSVLADCVFQQCHNRAGESTRQIQQQMEAHAAIHKAILDPVARLQDETMMAILLMDLATRLSAPAQVTSGTHMAGALALAVQRGDKSFKSPSSASLFTALRSSVLYYSLWQGGQDSYQALKALPDVYPNHGSLAARLNYLFAKAIVLDFVVGASVLARSNDSAGSELLEDAPQQTEAACSLLEALDEWLESTPLDWRLAVGRTPGSMSYLQGAALPSKPVLYLLGQWHCVKMNLIKILSNISPDLQHRRQMEGQGWIVFEKLRSLFSCLEAGGITQESHSRLTLEPNTIPGSYHRMPDGRHFLLNLVRWALEHVRDSRWSMQPVSRWALVKDYLVSEQARVVLALGREAKVSRLAQLF